MVDIFLYICLNENITSLKYVPKKRVDNRSSIQVVVTTTFNTYPQWWRLKLALWKLSFLMKYIGDESIISDQNPHVHRLPYCGFKSMS